MVTTTDDITGVVETHAAQTLTYENVFCTEDDPFALFTWKTIDVTITDADENVVFSQSDVEAPEHWSDRAIRVVAQKYFRGRLGTAERESSVRQLVRRVVRTIRTWAIEQEYFDADNAARFGNDLTYLLLAQYGAFNSPVWFNLGVDGEPQQVSACFIQSVDDDMQSIAQLQLNESMVFKMGSGTGSNLSPLRSRDEHLRGGGTASGPVSFMRGYDSWAGVIKSGGKTRRAAKMVILNADHPDIEEFITCKQKEEDRVQALIDAGYSPDFNDPEGAYASASFQNANHTVRVTDDFMDLVEDALSCPEVELPWDLNAITTDSVARQVSVHDLWRKLCKANWACGDPGIQFDTTINSWHTCPTQGRINGSNPCGEFMFLDDSACNLASLNLLKFRREDGTFDSSRFCHAVRVFIIAQEVMVDKAFYPTPAMAENSQRFRPLGLGYANLGAYLMSIGLPYDSVEGRQLTSEITSMMTAQAYRTSAMLAAHKEPFAGFSSNQGSMLSVIEQHRDFAANKGLESVSMWDDAISEGEEHGFRNAQVTLLAPTGTIGFMMDCDTTGVEPEASLYKVKKLVGGGEFVMENRIVALALSHLGYTQTQQLKIMAHLGEHKCLDSCSVLNRKHLAVFDCAIPSAGNRILSLDAHLSMTAAAQPFLSGAISKTMNVSHDTTVDQISEAFIQAWRLGLKAVTIYRDGCKLSQPLTTAAQAKKEQPRASRRKLQDHQTNVHRIKFQFGEVKGYLIATPYEDTGLPGEIFIEWAKEGSTVSGLVDGWAQAVSYGLQYGVPLEALVKKFSHTKFEPAGFSPDPDIRRASSIYDAMVRKLAAVFLSKPVENNQPIETAVESVVSRDASRVNGVDNPTCPVCGTITETSGANCYKCPQCGDASGCG